MTKMCFIQNTIYAARYNNILEENLIPFIPNFTTFDEYTFQQAHTVKEQQMALRCFRISIIHLSLPDLQNISTKDKWISFFLNKSTISNEI